MIKAASLAAVFKRAGIAPEGLVYVETTCAVVLILILTLATEFAAT